MNVDNELISWLLEESNPWVRLRALTGLCDLPEDHDEVKSSRLRVIQTLDAARDLSWMEQKGLALIYNLTALAESGLTREDVTIDPIVDKLMLLPFEAGCGDMMLLRALVMLGYGSDSRVNERIEQAADMQLEDGGWLCLQRVMKMNRTPKSCIKADMHGLLLFGELKKKAIAPDCSGRLIEYFLKRRLFYRMDNPTELVLNSRPGWRMTDVFFPIEVMRVGLPILLDAFAVLGTGRAPELEEAWRLLEEKADWQGKVGLDGTLSKAYLPKERVGKPSKWGTLYACLALKNRYI